MVQYIEKYKKNIAIDMRKRGMSYSDIGNRTHIPKSTLSYWLKNIKLTEPQIKELNNRRIHGAQKGSSKKSSQTAKLIEEIKNKSAKEIGVISKKELWLMGITLYWRERLLSGNENDIRKGVCFTSSDPYLIKLFLKWLTDIGGIKIEEIEFDIFLRNDKRNLIKEVISYWSDVTNTLESGFTHIYFQSVKPKRKRGGRTTISKTESGLLRIRVKSSSMLARQISGWMRGIVRHYWD